MAQGSATVKHVLSGDTVIIMGAAKSGPPPEKRLTLTGVAAPRLAKRSLTAQNDDEPLAYESREFLRKLVIGKVVEFKVEGSHNGREYGQIRFEGKDVAKLLVVEGLAKTHLSGQVQTSLAPELEEAEKAAQSAQKGIWSDTAQQCVRKITYGQENTSEVQALVEQYKGQQLPCIVEYIRDGGCYTCYFPEQQMQTTVLLTGVQIDQWRRPPRPPGQNTANGVANGSAANGDASGHSQQGPSQSSAPQPEPYAAEAKHFAEVRMLNREVSCRIEGNTDHGDIIGTLHHPKGGNFSLVLLKEGLGKIQEHSARLAESVGALREAQKEAQAKKLRKWKNFQVATLQGNSTKYPVKVIDVISGDALLIKDLSCNADRRVYLASTRAPRPGTKQREPEPWSFEARELARRLVVGKQCSASVEYIREPQPAAPGGSVPPGSDAEGRMHFVSICIEQDKQRPDLAEKLIEAGMARTAPHRAEDDRAKNYDKLVELEESARQQKVGVHSNNPAPKHRINDVCGAKDKAKHLEASLVRAGKMEGVVEYVFSGGRFKIRIASQNVAIAFCLNGIQVPATARPSVGGRGGMRDAEPFGEEAAAYARENVLQHDVSLRIDQCDKGGSFYGTLWRKNGNTVMNFAKELLELGLACTDDYSLSKCIDRQELERSEQNAREQKLRVWSLEGAENRAAGQQEEEAVVNETLNDVLVVHAEGVTELYLQEAKNSTLSKLMEDVDSAVANDDDDLSGTVMAPRTGELVLCRFSQDHKWYRATVQQRDHATDTYKVLYVDYGNSEKQRATNMRRCPPQLTLSAVPPQALHCALAGLMDAPEYERDGRNYLNKITLDVYFKCTVEKIDGQKKRYIILHPAEPAVSKKSDCTINEVMIRQGLARLDKKSTTKIFSKLQKEEEEARRARVNVWKYGDLGDADEDDEFPAFGKRGKGGVR